MTFYYTANCFSNIFYVYALAASDDGSDSGDDTDESKPDHCNETNEKELNLLDDMNDSAIGNILTKDLIFDWSNDSSVFKGERETFTGTPGPRCPISDASTPLDVFRLFFNDDLMTLLVEETNRYAELSLLCRQHSECSRMRKWQPVTREEMWTFLGILMWQGLYPLPVEKEYWVSPLSYITSSQMAKIMTYSSTSTF